MTMPSPKARGYLIVMAVIGVARPRSARSSSAAPTADLALQKEPFDRHVLRPVVRPDRGRHARAVTQLRQRVASAPDPNIRAIRIFPTQIILHGAAGKAVRIIEHDGTGHHPAGDLVQIVDDPDWLGAVRAATITLNAAVILQHGGAMTYRGAGHHRGRS